MNASLSYLARRLLWAATLVLGVASISFVVAHVLPGDPVRMLVGPQASKQDVEHARKLHGLDRPLGAQYFTYFRRLIHLAPPSREKPREKEQWHESCEPVLAGLHVDLGYSFHYRKSVVALLKAKVPRSLELALVALAVQALIGIAVGTAAAARRGSRTDDVLIGATLIGISAPTFVLGVLLQYLLAYRLRLLPYDGYGTTPAEHLRSLILPGLTLGIFGTAVYARLVRAEMTSILHNDYIRAARAKGASRLRAVVVHALRNALVPICTLVALDFGTLIGGAIVTEKLFRWPGVGSLAVEALLNRDGPVIIGTVLFSSLAVVLCTLALDLLYLVLDPRLRAPLRDPASGS